MATAARIPALVVAFALAALGGPAPASAVEAVDLELVIAVDVSGSIDEDEAKLQRQGYVTAFTDPTVVSAIRSGFNGRIAVLYFEWAGFGHNKIVADWTLIDGPDSASALALALSRAPMESARRTSISGAIDFAVPLFATNAYSGRRRVIDISGDGVNNFGRPITAARNAAVIAGITINGLPVINDRPGRSRFSGPSTPDLDLYYENCVIGGPGAFIVVARGFEDFAAAVRRKLVLEVAGSTPDGRPGLASAASPVAKFVPAAERLAPACDIEERQWGDFGR